MLNLINMNEMTILEIIYFGLLGTLLVNGDNSIANGLNGSKNDYYDCNNSSSFGFLCGSGECIPRDQECDGTVDCRDASDETRDCLRLQCPTYAFRCLYGACIDSNLECDEKHDCQDGSDENESNCKNSITCGRNEFRCGSGECIAGVLKCDGKPDCQDYSDETRGSCRNFKCPGYAYRCRYGGCVDGTAVCNGTIECFDGSDEDCKPLTKPDGCVLPKYSKYGPWSVVGNKVYSPGMLVEFGTKIYVQCNRANNLDGVATLVCLGEIWSTPIGNCTSSLVVNGDNSIANELNGSKIDYYDCNNSSSFGFLCGSGECIPRDQECDGAVNCRDASDETRDCSRLQCPTYVFRCLYGACIDPNLECDGKRDCRDGSDENTTNCRKSTTSCGRDEFRCSSGECIRDGLKCDGKPHCRDYSDETMGTCWNFKCPGFAYRCRYGGCVDGTAVCNGTTECFDGSDEECRPLTNPDNCILPKYSQYDSWSIMGKKIYSPGMVVNSGNDIYVQCNQANILDGVVALVCIEGKWLSPIWNCTSTLLVNGANSIDNGLNGSTIDNNDCKNSSSFGYLCGSGECIPRDQECDGTVNCRDGSDETRNCSRLQCPTYVFRCLYGACIDPNLECDGKRDCRDGSDELNCRKASCGRNEFRCNSGECIRDGLKCDGKPHCQDSSDEAERTCRNFKCPGYAYRCRYGGCVDGTAVCNGTTECFDGSDEECTPLIKPDSCILPAHSQFGSWSFMGNTVYSPGMIVESGTVIYVQCNQTNILDGLVTLVCSRGKWSSPVGSCTKQAPIVINIILNVNISPRHNNDTDPDRIIFPRSATLK